MPGRNAPCPCGSGKKYKKCCLRAVVSETFTDQERHTAMARLCAFSSEPQFARVRGTAQRLFDQSPLFRSEELEAIAARAMMWSLCDVEMRDGRTIVGCFLASGVEMAPGERAYLDRLAGSHLALYEVVDVVPEDGIRLGDVWGGRPAWVRERTGSHTLAPGDLLAGRLVECGPGVSLLAGDAVPFPQEEREALVASLEETFAVWLRRRARDDRSRFLKGAGFLFNNCAVDRALDVDFRAPDGEVVEVCEARYHIEDCESMAEWIARHPAFRESGDAWECVEQAQRLGWAYLKRGALVATSPTRSRLERLCAILERSSVGAPSLESKQYYALREAAEKLTDRGWRVVPSTAPTADSKPCETATPQDGSSGVRAASLSAP
jgi:hypothetical protein